MCNSDDATVSHNYNYCHSCQVDFCQVCKGTGFYHLVAGFVKTSNRYCQFSELCSFLHLCRFKEVVIDERHARELRSDLCYFSMYLLGSVTFVIWLPILELYIYNRAAVESTFKVIGKMGKCTMWVAAPFVYFFYFFVCNITALLVLFGNLASMSIVLFTGCGIWLSYSTSTDEYSRQESQKNSQHTACNYCYSEALQ